MQQIKQPTNCLITAWGLYEAELRGWLISHLENAQEAEDLLQEVFLKALRQGSKFCQLDNARAWMFTVTRHTLIDRQRLKKNMVDLPEDLAIDDLEVPAVKSLASCLPRALSELADTDRDVISRCDLEGITQEAYARQTGLSITAVKSRIQRARQRLRLHLTEACQVRTDDSGNVCCFVPRPSGNSD